MAKGAHGPSKEAHGPSKYATCSGVAYIESVNWEF